MPLVGRPACQLREDQSFGRSALRLPARSGLAQSPDECSQILKIAMGQQRRDFIELSPAAVVVAAPREGHRFAGQEPEGIGNSADPLRHLAEYGGVEWREGRAKLSPEFGHRVFGKSGRAGKEDGRVAIAELSVEKAQDVQAVALFDRQGQKHERFAQRVVHPDEQRSDPPVDANGRKPDLQPVPPLEDVG